MEREESICQKAIESVQKGEAAFCKFLAAIDTGKANTHQSGIYAPKSAAKMLLDTDLKRGENINRIAKVKWQGDIVLENKFTYYGKAKNELRITRFGRGFKLLGEENTGSLLVFVRIDAEDYEAWILDNSDEIDDFLDFFGMSPADTNNLINYVPDDEDALRIKALQEMDIFIDGLEGGFPKARDMSATARRIFNDVYDHMENIVRNPDKELIDWNQMEYTLFRRIEEVQYGDIIRNGFDSMQNFVDVANSVLNRRKSRAGKSLEFHLEALFQGNKLPYEAQVITEERKKPDFVFPSGAAYHDKSYPREKLIVLGAKTTCKDRWRQVVTEADEVKTKYLCTLQQGISPQQLHEMKSENVVLVVPKEYISKYPAEYRADIFSLAKFIDFVREKLA